MLWTLIPIVVVDAVLGSRNLIFEVLIDLQAVLKWWCPECATTSSATILSICVDTGWRWIINSGTINSILLLGILVCGIEGDAVPAFSYVLEIPSIDWCLMITLLLLLLLFLLFHLLISLIDNLLLLFLLPFFT